MCWVSIFVSLQLATHRARRSRAGGRDEEDVDEEALEPPIDEESAAATSAARSSLTRPNHCGPAQGETSTVTATLLFLR